MWRFNQMRNVFKATEGANELIAELRRKNKRTRRRREARKRAETKKA